MLAKLTTLGLFKGKVDDVIIFVHYAANKILSCYSNHIVDVVI